MLAASLSGISRIIFHVISDEELMTSATDLYSELFKSSGSLTSFLHQLEGKNLKWGLSNGT